MEDEEVQEQAGQMVVDNDSNQEEQRLARKRKASIDTELSAKRSKVATTSEATEDDVIEIS
jgi:hypothetical protein